MMESAGGSDPSSARSEDAKDTSPNSSGASSLALKRLAEGKYWGCHGAYDQSASFTRSIFPGALMAVDDGSLSRLNLLTGRFRCRSHLPLFLFCRSRTETNDHIASRSHRSLDRNRF